MVVVNIAGFPYKVRLKNGEEIVIPYDNIAYGVSDEIAESDFRGVFKVIVPPKIKMISSTLEFHNIHKGKRGIICGSGYSIDNFDFGKLSKDDIIFAVNQSVTAMKRCNYFCMTDVTVVGSNFFEYGYNISDKIMMCSGLSFYNYINSNLYQKIKDKTHFLNRRYNNKVNASFNLNDGVLIDGADVIHPTAHLAHIMGCSPIVLIGVDLNYKDGKKYCDSKEFKKEVEWPANTGTPTKPFGNASGADDFLLTTSFNMWLKVKDQNPNVKFLNANPKGRLTELFETIQL
jgi:hypothetical protein